MHKAKPVLIFLGAILVALFPLSRWIASEYLRHLPRQYFSAVTVEIKPDVPDLADPAGSADSSGRSATDIFGTQFHVIKKSEILTPVIEKLDLVKKFSPPGVTMPIQWVTEVLSRSIFVREQRNTNLIEIGVYHTDRQLAADIANTVAITYRDKRIEAMRKEMDLSLAEMKDELKTKEDEMNKLFQEASRIRQEEKIVDPDPESANAILSITAEGALRGIETLLVEKRALVDQLRKQLARIEQLKPEELMEALRMLGLSDQAVEKMLPLLQDAKPEILSDTLQSILRSQRTKLGIEEATLKSYEEKVKSPRKPLIDEKTRMNRYVEKKAAYLMTKQLLLSIRQRYDAARFDNTLSQVPVKIWQRAEPAQVPARPDAVHILWWVNVIGGSVAAIGVFLILIGARIPSRMFSRAEVQD